MRPRALELAKVVVFRQLNEIEVGRSQLWSERKEPTGENTSGSYVLFFLS